MEYIVQFNNAYLISQDYFTQVLFPFSCKKTLFPLSYRKQLFNLIAMSSHEMYLL